MPDQQAQRVFITVEFLAGNIGQVQVSTNGMSALHYAAAAQIVQLNAQNAMREALGGDAAHKLVAATVEQIQHLGRKS